MGSGVKQIGSQSVTDETISPLLLWFFPFLCIVPFSPFSFPYLPIAFKHQKENCFSSPPSPSSHRASIYSLYRTSEDVTERIVPVSDLYISPRSVTISGVSFRAKSAEKESGFFSLCCDSPFSYFFGPVRKKSIFSGEKFPLCSLTRNSKSEKTQRAK